MNSEAIVGRLYPRAHKALALAFLFVACLAVFTNITHNRQMDFIAYWAAGVLALGGKAAAAYDLAAHQAVQNSVAIFHTKMPFAYPPPFLFLALPFALMPYAAAAALWILISVAAYLVLARKLLPGSLWLAAAFPPVVLNAMIGQNGLITAALFMAGLLCLEKRPFIAGLLFGCLIIKPQLAPLLPIAFIAGRQWRAFAGAAVSSVGLLLLGWLCFGTEAYVAMFKALPLFASIATDGLVGWHKMASVYAALSMIGLPHQIALALHIGIAVAAGMLVAVIWRGDHAIEAKVAALAAASMLMSPYLYIYDAVLLIIPFFWLAKAGANPRLLAFLWCVPLVSILQSWVFSHTVNLMPFLPIVLLALIYRRLYPNPGTAKAAVFVPADA